MDKGKIMMGKGKIMDKGKIIVKVKSQVKGKVKVNVQEEGNTVFEDSMSKDDMMQLYLGLGQKEGNHVEVGTDGQGNYTLNLIKSFAKGGIANHFRIR